MSPITVENWEQANAKLTELANGLPIFLGSGSPIDRPHVIASYLDALSGEGMGYSVWIFPQGSNGLYGMGRERPHDFCTIRLGKAKA